MNKTDMVIASGLAKIREGILNDSWTLVCDGYNLISGETLSPPLPKIEDETSRLDNIRNLINKEKELADQIDPAKNKNVDLNSMEIIEIRRWLFEVFGMVVEESSFESKEQLIVVAQDIMNSFSKETNLKQSGSMTIISSEHDEDESKHNKETKTRKYKSPKRATEIKNLDNSSKPDAPVRYSNNPSHAAPWRE